MFIILIISIVIILFSILIVGLIYADILIDVKNCHILYSDTKFDVEKLDIIIKICIFKFLKIKISKNVKIDILEKIKKNEYDENTVISIIKLLIDSSRKKVRFKDLNPKLDSLDLCLYFGTSNQMVTTFSIPIISTVLSIYLSKLVSNYSREFYNYRIFPEYSNKNYLSINLITEIKFKLINLLFFAFKMKNINKKLIFKNVIK